jgi:3-oxoacyl-[acyl-carrier protein] reductase
MDLGIRGRTALVTGASMGIGKGIATALAREGVRLAVVARRRNLLAELEQELGQKLVIIECDLLKENSFEEIAQAASTAWGRSRS